MLNSTKILDEIIKKYGSGKDQVIPILQAIQKQYNYLPEDILQTVCDRTEITYSQIAGVASFYSQFRLKPAGKHLIKVCIGTACHVKGALHVFDAFARSLKLDGDQDTDIKGIFTLQKVACLGCCTLAPAVQIDDVTYGKVGQSDIPEILDNFLSKQNSQENKNPILKTNKSFHGEIRLGLGSCCIASGSNEVRKAVIHELQNTGINPLIKQVGCVGMCHQVPLLEIIPEGKPTVTYAKVKPEDVKGILLNHFHQPGLFNRLKNKLEQHFENIYLNNFDTSTDKCFLNMKEKPVADFFNKQIHIATSLKGVLNPLDINDYIKKNGFKSLEKCLKKMSQKEIIDTIKESGLRGRGGAGFPTGVKLEIFLNQNTQKKYIICNGDEGDPGAFMDRMLLESFPFRVIEGMIIAAFATGATNGFFYIRAEYQLAVIRIKEAIQICIQNNYLGNSICASDFSFEIQVFEGAGAFVCGEETAMIASMEGHRGMPTVRPPYPVISGLNDAPTLVNNVETFSNISFIIFNGASEFNKTGTKSSKGTKVFALAGKIARGGLIEVPMGITIKEIVEEIGGGIQGNKKFKAVQIGGPSGGCIPASMANTPIDYQYLNEIGAMMGSGGLVVLDETDCVVDIAKYFLTFTQNQSCGKCVFCRVGTKHLLQILENISVGKAKMEDLKKLEDLSLQVIKGSLCGLGKSAPNPILTTLKYFREEYISHINGVCPAKKCKELITYSINEKCIGCTKCVQECPTGAIENRPYEIHHIDTEKCIKCNICKQVCPTDAVNVTTNYILKNHPISTCDKRD